MSIPLRSIGNSVGIVLPKWVLRQLAMETGDRLILQVQGGQVILTPGGRPKTCRIGTFDDVAIGMSKDFNAPLPEFDV